MARSPRPGSLKAIANQKVEDYIWGVPESPELSSVQRLMNEFQSHASREERWLSSYKEIEKTSNDPLVRFLLGLIVADEERHHELMRRMVAKLKDELAWTRSHAGAREARERGEKGKQLLISVGSFLDTERKGIKDYERLKKASQGLYRNVFSLLYTTMIHDSYKHIGILEFLRLRLKANRAAVRKGRRDREPLAEAAPSER